MEENRSVYKVSSSTCDNEQFVEVGRSVYKVSSSVCDGELKNM